MGRFKLLQISPELLVVMWRRLMLKSLMTDGDPRGRNISLQFTPSCMITQQCLCKVLLVSINFGGFMCKTFHECCYYVICQIDGWMQYDHMSVHRVQTISGVFSLADFLRTTYIPHCQIKTLEIPYDTVYTMHSSLLCVQVRAWT